MKKNLTDPTAASKKLSEEDLEKVTGGVIITGSDAPVPRPTNPIG